MGRSSVGFIKLRRRAAVASFALLMAFYLGAPARSSAAPSASLTAGFAAGTRLGEPTTLTATLNLTGSEYYGQPLPLSQLTLRTPPGTALSDAGLPRCETSVLINLGPSRCPAGSEFMFVGSLTGFVAFGDEYLEEQAPVEFFFDPEGGVSALLHGSNPASYELIAHGEYLPAEGDSGPGLRLSLPAIETVVGNAPLASTKSLTIPLGAFYEHGGVTAAAVIAPKECTSDLRWSLSAKLSDEKGTEATTDADTTSACPGVSKSEEEAAIAKKASEEAQAKKAAEEAAAKKAAEERDATVRIKKVKVGTGRILVTVRLTHAGSVTISGPGLSKTVVSLAAGTHQIAVALTAAGRRERRHRKTITLRVSLKMSSATVRRSGSVKL